MVTSHETLRRLTIGDPVLIAAMAGPGHQDEVSGRLDDRTEALLRIGVLVALDAPQSSYVAAVSAAQRAGAREEDLVAVLAAIASTVGSARLVSAAPLIARAAGYDIDAALEGIDSLDH
jgi:alkylhydroperoxidase/carboxymuconolactone decarboxylase family protein YurZ